MRRPVVRPSLVATTLLAAALVLGGCGSSEPSRAAPAATSEQAAPGPSHGSAPPARVATPATSQVRAERPLSVTLPSGRVLPVDPAGTRPDGVLAVPDDVNRAGWWKGSSRLGDPFGGIVLAAHVDSFAEGVGPAAELVTAQRGDPLRLTGRHLTQQYRIVSVRSVPRADLRHETVVFSAAGDPRLVLVTCGGAYDAARGGYQDNVVVVARPSGR